MTREQVVQEIMTSLANDLMLFSLAAQTSHQAATHEECLPDNKYDTTALEASYLAQGQANRAQEIRVALENYRTLPLQHFDDDTPIRLTALVTLDGEDGSRRCFFLGPHAGGMKVGGDHGAVVITPASPLGRSLLGLQSGDELRVGETWYTVATVR